MTFRQEPARIFDLMSQTPESMHMFVNLFSPRGIPSDHRHMQGFGVNTYRWVNAEGETHLVKYHWMPAQGVRSMTAENEQISFVTGVLADGRGLLDRGRAFRPERNHRSRPPDFSPQKV